MFTLSNILLTILWIFIVISFCLGFYTIFREGEGGLFLPWDEWSDNILQTIFNWYLFICELVVISPAIIIISIFALSLTRSFTNPEEFPEPEPIILKKKIKGEPKTKSICNWAGLAKNIIEEQERKGYRYTGTSSGIICDEQLNFVKIEN